MSEIKPVHSLVLDAGAIIKNEPSVSVLIAKSEVLLTVPAIVDEIRDATARARMETTLKPFLTLRSPSAVALKFVTEFARKTGDLAVLSKPDLQIIALTYDVECERNGGDWRLRRTPGQKGLNGAPPESIKTLQQPATLTSEAPSEQQGSQDAAVSSTEVDSNRQTIKNETVPLPDETADALETSAASKEIPDHATHTVDDMCESLQAANLDTSTADGESPPLKVDSAQHSAASEEDEDSDGWITPSNLKQKQAESKSAVTKGTDEPKVMQAAVVTSDFAMQNVILRMNLNLLSPKMSRIQQLRTYVLRCHACFNICKELDKQFCPRCGGPTLTRVSCSTNANGEFKLHLKKNMQWNTRGDRFSIPKPVHGSANGRIQGGGKNSWGHGLILAEDQKEYQDASRREKRQKEKNLMDEDYLPGILTGNRATSGGRMRVGAGRNVNSRKR